MVWINILLLFLIGVLGIAAWVTARRPDAAQHLSKLQQFEGWIGLIALVWGLFQVLRWLTALNAFRYAPFMMLVWLVAALVMVALGYLLALPLVKSVTKTEVQGKLDQLSMKLAPYKVGLGFAALALCLYYLIRVIF